MGNTMNRLDGKVQDYPDESYMTNGADPYPPDSYDELLWPTNHRWRQVAALFGGVVALGAVATAVIINSGDSATTKATVGAPTSLPVLTTPSTPLPATPSITSRTPQLPPETVTTMAPPSVTPPAQTTTTALPLTGPPPAALHPRTVIYSVTGTKELLDLVTVVYTDARGYPKTEFNVALPWTRAVVLNPGIQTQSVVATSFHSQLNCSIVNAKRQPVVASTNNAIITTCIR
ncbi:MmpS family transport accessory protein [Mycobacterium uberis]|uniref:MmpS family transport accessory protein n=1 Tax=Mycobacterium uberis TaxID=2162698 RepID=UPI001A9E420A|nr:MmpS family transport accessory protein [Mycobacterium uberis]